jgi:thioredoxin-like negative regulator of GroEL
VHFAWLQLRMGWPTVGKIRLDQEKKDSIAAIISHYHQTGVPDRARAEFDQVLQRLEEEHAMRLKELLKEQRRAAKQQNNPIQIIQETNASKVRQRIELTEETPPLIDEWKQLIVRLF